MPVKYSICMIIIAVLFVSNIVYAGDTNPMHYQLEPKSIMHEIESRGANVVVQELYSNFGNVWLKVESSPWYLVILKKIASGDESWLKTAVALRPGTDAAETETLDSAVGEALEHNPVNVFKITLKVFSIREICGTIEYDDPRFNSYEHAMKTINLRIHKVGSIRSIESAVTECIQYLEATKEDIAHFYEVNK
jgi:hypothetical protein